MSLLNPPYEEVRSPFRTFRRAAAAQSDEQEVVGRRQSGVLWGVARREGCTDLDDPSAHAGLAQHAFLFGCDDQALCGYRPPRRHCEFTDTVRAELAVPSPEYNPLCPKCRSLVPASADHEGERDTSGGVDAPLIGATEVERVMRERNGGIPPTRGAMHEERPTSRGIDRPASQAPARMRAAVEPQNRVRGPHVGMDRLR